MSIKGFLKMLVFFLLGFFTLMTVLLFANYTNANASEPQFHSESEYFKIEKISIDQDESYLYLSVVLISQKSENSNDYDLIVEVVHPDATLEFVGRPLSQPNEGKILNKIIPVMAKQKGDYYLTFGLYDVRAKGAIQMIKKIVEKK